MDNDTKVTVIGTVKNISACSGCRRSIRHTR